MTAKLVTDLAAADPKDKKKVTITVAFALKDHTWYEKDYVAEFFAYDWQQQRGEELVESSLQNLVNFYTASIPGFASEIERLTKEGKLHFWLVVKHKA